MDDFKGNNAFKIKTGIGANQSITVSKILDDFNSNDIPAIIKIDIEGHEYELFQSSEWLELFFLVIVEIHDWMDVQNPKSRNFIRSLTNGNFSIITKSNIIFAMNLNYSISSVSR